MGLLAELEAEMAALDDDAVSGADAGELLGRVGRARRLLVGHEVRLITILDGHAAKGEGPQPEDLFAKEGDCSGGEARRRARRSRAAKSFPGLDAKVRSGEARTENVDAIARAHDRMDTDEARAALAALDPELADMAQRLPPAEFKRRLDAIVRRICDEHGRTLAEKRRAAAVLRRWIDKDGMRRLSATLDPEWGDAVDKAIDREMRALANAVTGEPRTMNDHLAAEALVEIALRSADPDTRMARPLVGMLLDHRTHLHGEHDRTISELFDGTPVEAATRARLCCDADVQRIIIGDDGLPLAVGRTYRTATAAQRMALRSIYRGCGWGGCDRRFDWCQIHHVVEWEDGGQTDIENLVPLCNRHHHLVHEGRWRLELASDRTLTVIQPDGVRYARYRPDGPVVQPRSADAAPGWSEARRRTSDN